MFKKIILNTSAQVAAKVFTGLTSFVITFLIAKSLKDTGYGDFIKITVFVGYFYTLADFGLNTIYVKLSKEDETQNLRTLIGLRLIIGVSLALASVLIGAMVPYNSALTTGFSPLVKTGIALASITIITQALFLTANAYYQKNLKYELSALSAISSYIFVLATAAIVTLTNQSLLGYVTAYVVGGVVLVSVAFSIIQRRTKTQLSPQFSKQQFKKFLKPAWPVGVALIFNLIYFRIDVFILSNVRSSSEVGLYGLAYQFFEAALTIPIFFSNAIYPLLANLYQTDKKRYKKEAKKWGLLLLIFSAVISASTFAISFFLPKIFGVAFAGSTPALQVLSIGFPFFFLSALFWHMLIILNRQKFLTLIYAAGAIFNVTANLIFIPRNGYMAASVITVVSEALIVILLFIAVWRFKND